MEQRQKGSDEKFCPNCGELIHFQAEICPKCGVRVAKASQGSYIDEHRTWLIVLVLCMFLGALGMHRFYTRKYGTGLLMLLTAGGCGIWVIVDLIMIVTGNFTDKDGYRIY